MEKPVAASVVEIIVALKPYFSELDALSYRIPEGEERRNFRRALGKLMADLGGDILLPIIWEHPDLDPDR
ncbi:MAG: hypothetical protein ACOY3L_03700 [Pseudomonadota bacterium]